MEGVCERNAQASFIYLNQPILIESLLCDRQSTACQGYDDEQNIVPALINSLV